jgi:hypothetical protein
MLAPDDFTAVARATAFMRELESVWPEIAARAAELPPTLVHGDFAPKNIRLRLDGDELAVLAFDWEHAGLGPPAVDLAGAETSLSRGPALDIYLATIRPCWRDVTLSDLERAVHVGVALRYAAAFDWEAARLTGRGHDRVVRRLMKLVGRVQTSVDRGLGIPVSACAPA